MAHLSPPFDVQRIYASFKKGAKKILIFKYCICIRVNMGK